jgi:enoyl-CoA hydratase
MTNENIRLEMEGPLAILTVSRPKQLNALNSQTLREMEVALHSLAQNAQIRALIVTGAGDKAFVAGADISEMVNLTPQQAGALSGLGHRVVHLMESLSFPTIAAVNGYAFGGGCELALCCDLIYASQNAKFGLPEVGLGVIPGFGGTQRLTRLVGRVRAKELIFTGEPIDAAKAQEIGLVLEVIPSDRLMDHCKDIAAKVGSKAPLAVSQAKRVIEDGSDQHLRGGNELERHAFAILFSSDDQTEGMRAFLEKRKPVFKGS